MQLSEVYTSIQGEGPRTGVPTVFVRFAGCNLKCPGWPCDTQHAIDPALYRDQWKTTGPREIFDLIRQEQNFSGARNICLTGGEPFLQKGDDLRELCQLMLATSYETTIEVFTNGTLLWPSWAVYHLRFIMDWKLKGSGDTTEFDYMMRNATHLRPKDAVKFTVASLGDFEEAVDIWKRYRDTLAGKPPKVYCGPVWGKMEAAEVASLILANRLQWRLNVQLHKFVWDPEARRT
jgi:7-carboxy-7-deazaguanine synthase